MEGMIQQNYSKKGNGLLWTIIIITLIIAIIGLVMSITYPYSKTQTDQNINTAKTEALTEIDKKADKPGCEIIQIDGTQGNVGKMDTDLCTAINKEPILRINYKHERRYDGESGSATQTDFCNQNRLISEEYITETTRTNIGSTVELFDSECTANPLEGTAYISKTTEVNILCC